MDCLDAVYDWESKPSTEAADAASLPQPCCCSERSPVELEVQQLRAKAELALLRDRVRKALTTWLAVSRSSEPAAPPVRIEWKVEPADLVHNLCYWQHASALSKVAMTPCLVELIRQHRRLEGIDREPPASKNKLTLVVWNLAAIVQAKLREWHTCVADDTEDTFSGVIVVNTCDLIPIWMWEADALRHRPMLTDLCDRMLSMELYQYRQCCNQLSQLETTLSRGGQVPQLTPFGLRWPTRARSAARSAPPSTPSTKTLSSAAQDKRKKKKEQVFAGETFCVSGAFSVSQKTMLSLLSDNGGVLAASVCRPCTCLVAESMGSAKTKKAHAQGIPIVTEAWVRVSIAAGKKSTDSSLFLANGPTTRSASYRNSLSLRSPGVIVISANSHYDSRRSGDTESGSHSEAITEANSSSDEDDQYSEDSPASEDSEDVDDHGRESVSSVEDDVEESALIARVNKQQRRPTSHARPYPTSQVR